MKTRSPVCETSLHLGKVHMFFGFYPKEDWSRSSGGF